MKKKILGIFVCTLLIVVTIPAWGNSPTSPPVADFSYTYDDDFVVYFEDESYDPDGGEITYWEWDFGDGTFGDEENPVHDYKTPSVVSVTHWVGDDQQEYGSVTKLVNLSEQTFLIGLIGDKEVYGGYISFHTVFTLSVSVHTGTKIYSSGEEVITWNDDSRGFIGNNFIFGRFNAAVLLD